MAGDQVIRFGRFRKDLSAQKFGRLLVVSFAGSNEKWEAIWLCRCDCGKELTVLCSRLTKGNVKSCGCYRRDALKSRSAKSVEFGKKNPAYGPWRAMVRRCHDEGNSEFHKYGEKGVSVCESWRSSFRAFLNYMGPRPSASHSIDRFPNRRGNYESGNVRWATKKQQTDNRDITFNVTINGETKPLADWCRNGPVAYGTAKYRIQAGMSPEIAVAAPSGSIWELKRKAAKPVPFSVSSLRPPAASEDVDKSGTFSQHPHSTSGAARSSDPS